MKKLVLLFLGLVFAGSLSATAFAQTSVSAIDTTDREADHDALRIMLIDAEKAINEGRFDDMIKYLDPNVNIIYQNAEVADGISEVKAFQERIFSESNGVLKGIKTKVTADILTEFYGDTAIAYGTAVDHYTFVGGLEMDLKSKWSTTLVKEGTTWKVVSLQFTSNLFDNPLLAKAQAIAKYSAIGGLAVGLVLGFFTFRYLRRKKS